MSTKDRYQVMPDLSPEEYAALKADIAANGVRIPIEVDEEGNTIDGGNRKQICDELGIECPTRPFFGHTEEEKLDHALRLNLMRRHLTRKQKRKIACTLREEGWTQERIAQVLGVSQSTIGNWLHEFTNSGKLRQPTNVQGKDGKEYRPEKTRRRTTHPTEEANRPETPQIPSVTSEGPAQALERQETPQPRDTPAEAQSPTSELAVASDVPDAPERLSLLSDEWHPVPVEQASSPLGSSPVLPAEADAGGWVNALQDLFAKLETLQTQGSLLSLNRRLAPKARAQAMATIRHMQEILIALESVVEADMGEAADKIGNDIGATPSSVPPPTADEVQEHGNRELVTVSSAEEPVRDAADSDQLPSQGGAEGSPPREQVLPVQEEEKQSTQEPLTAPSRPTRTRTRRSKTEVLAALPRGELPEAVPGAAATLTENSGRANDAAPLEPCSPDVQAAGDVATPATQNDPCGWCGSTEVSPLDSTQGRVHCKACHAVYNPRNGCWDPGERDKQQRPPALLPATAA